MFWKEVQRIRKEISGKEERLKTKDGIMMVENKAVTERWADYFEGMLKSRGK